MSERPGATDGGGGGERREGRGEAYNPRAVSPLSSASVIDEPRPSVRPAISPRRVTPCLAQRTHRVVPAIFCSFRRGRGVRARGNSGETRGENTPDRRKRSWRTAAVSHVHRFVRVLRQGVTAGLNLLGTTPFSSYRVCGSGT